MRNSFDPGEMALLARVVDQACTELGNLDASAKSLIAARIVAYASQGKRDFKSLLSIALHGSPGRRERHAA
jgi:hypothetical protein